MMETYEVRYKFSDAVKALSGLRLEVLGVPFGDPKHKDLEGEYFAPDTEIFLEPGERI